MSTATERIEDWAATGKFPRRSAALDALSKLLRQTEANLKLYRTDDPARQLQEGVILGIKDAIECVKTAR